MKNSSSHEQEKVGGQIRELEATPCVICPVLSCSQRFSATTQVCISVTIYIYNTKFTILTILSIQPSGTKYIHIVVQPSPPSISTTLSSSQHSARFTPGQVPPKTNDPCLEDMESQLLISRALKSLHLAISEIHVTL